MMCQNIIEKGPTRILVNREGEAVAPRRAADIKPDVIFIRDDGWSLGTLLCWEEIARKMWKDKWVCVMRRVEGGWEAEKYSTNNNCLDGIRCPKCGSQEPFQIVAMSTFLVYDSGTDGHADVEWNDDSPIRCKKCDCTGQIRDFRTVVEFAGPMEIPTPVDKTEFTE